MGEGGRRGAGSVMLPFYHIVHTGGFSFPQGQTSCRAQAMLWQPRVQILLIIPLGAVKGDLTIVSDVFG